MPIQIKSSAKLDQSHFKLLIYGRPGKGKTMITPTAPKPVLLLTEPGGSDSLTQRNIEAVFGKPEAHGVKLKKLMAEGASKEEAEAYIKNSTITYDIPRLEVFNHPLLAEALAFLETDTAYETVILDSASQLSKMLLQHFETAKTAKGKTNSLQRAYGDQAKAVTDCFQKLLHLNKHVVFLCQAAELNVNMGTEDEPAMVPYLVPSFEGRVLKMSIPHLVGEIYQADTKIDDNGRTVHFLKTRPSEARGYEKSRMSILDAEEEPHLGLLFDKLKGA